MGIVSWRCHWGVRPRSGRWSSRCSARHSFRQNPADQLDIPVLLSVPLATDRLCVRSRVEDALGNPSQAADQPRARRINPKRREFGCGMLYDGTANLILVEKAT